MARAKSGSWLPWLGLALVIILADQFTKVLILGSYRLGDSTYVAPFFNIVRAHNTGAAFSFLAAASGWQRWFFTAIGIAAAIFIVWLLRSHSGQKLFSFALSCVLGRRHRQRGGPAAARLCGRLRAGALARLVFPGFQCGRQRHHHRRGLPDPGRTAAGPPREIAPRACGQGRCAPPSAINGNGVGG